MNIPSPNDTFEPISFSDEDLAQVAAEPDSVSSSGASSVQKRDTAAVASKGGGKLLPSIGGSSGQKLDSATVAAKGGGKLLPPDFQPSNYDVLCGRGKGCASWIGNRRFRVTISINKDRYVAAPTKIEKSVVVDEIVKTIKAASPEGGFIRKDAETGRWCKITTQQARDKVGHAMRDAVQAADGKRTQRKRRRSSRASTSRKQQKKQRKPAPVAMAMESTAAAAPAPVPMAVPSNPEVQPIQVSTSIRNSIRSSLRGSFRDAGFAAFILEALGGKTGDDANQEDTISLFSETALFRSLQDTAAVI